MTTFKDLGLDVPLFAAPIEDASDYIGEATCTLCHLEKAHCFELGIGEDIILACPNCQTLNALDADDQEDGVCSACTTLIQFPETNDDSVKACYDCIQQGKATFTQDTELGMVRWEDAHQDGWLKGRIPVASLLELVQTPNYLSWQGEQWLFCHQKPMIYLGRWGQEEFRQAAPDGNAQAFFFQVVESNDQYLWDYANSSSVGIYVFRCQECSQVRAHFDYD